MRGILAKTLLLVEDDVLIAMKEVNQLEKEGYHVIHAIDGKEAIEIVVKKRNEIDLILMDIDLGSGIDGTDTAIEILKHHTIPIIFLSSRVEKDIVQKTEKITSYGYVVKNSEMIVLDASIKMAFKLYEANQKTERQRERLSTILHSIGDAVIATDRQGDIVQMNPVSETLTGWNFPDANGKPLQEIFQIIDGSTQQKIINSVESVLASGKIIVHASNAILISKSGKEYKISDSLSPIKDSENTITGVVLVFRDITRDYEIQKQIEASEQLYHAIFANSRSVKLLIDPTNGNIIDANSAASAYYGYPLNELKNINISQINILSQERIKEEMQEAALQRRNHFNFTHRLANGDLRDVEVYSSPINVKGKFLLHSIINDVTERKRLEAALNDNERNMKILLDTMTEGVALNQIIYDKAGEMIDYKVLNVNQAFYSMADYNQIEVIGSSARNLYNMSAESIRKFWMGHQGMRTTVFTEIWSRLRNKCYFIATSPFVNDKFVTTFLDITERKLAETALAEFNRDFENFLKETTDFIFFKDRESRIRFCSQSMANITGYANWRDLIGKNDFEVFPPDMAKIYNEEELPIFEKGKPLLGKINPYYDEAGNIGYVSTNKWPLFDNASNVVGIFGISRDITERKRIEEQLEKTKIALENANRELEQLSNTDELTGIGNRRYFEKIFEKECLRSRRNSSPLSILIIDIDDFKSYNDYFGHLAGDKCLKIVAKTIAGLARRAADLAARWGGEEFIVLLPETNLSEACIVAEKIRANVQELAVPHPIARAANVITLSVGAAAWAYQDPQELISRADNALYSAKKNGRNRVET